MPDPAAMMPAGAVDPEADEALELADAAGPDEGPEDAGDEDGSIEEEVTGDGSGE